MGHDQGTLGIECPLDVTFITGSTSMRTFLVLGAAAAAVVATACSDTGTNTAPSSQLAITMASAYSSTPTGFGSLSTSFGDSGATFEPGFGLMRHGGDHGFDGRGDGPGFGLGLMGGGLGGGFLGDGFGRDDFHSDTACAFAAGTLTCGPTVHNGLTITRTFQFTTAAGVAQQKIDSTTDKVVSTATVKGTATRRDSSTSTVNEASTRTVTGLAAGSTQVTVSGTSGGTESTTGTSMQGTFTASRTVGDTTTGLIMPVRSSTNPHPFPTAGTVIRAMSATITITGQSPATTSRREVVTYDGSATAKVVITLNGTTQNCTLPLPHGRLVCQ